MKLRLWDLWRMALRSLWLQGLWTVQRGQNLGCVFSLWPVLERLYPDPEERAPAACAHAAYFSTHPYTAGIILGVVAGLEEQRATAAGPAQESVLAVRTAMSGPLAAVGEAFFWSTWRPVCFLFALAAFAWRGPAPLVPAIFLAAYNAVHLGARAAGIWFGYRWKTEVVSKIAAFRIQRLMVPLALAGLLACAAALALLSVKGVVSFRMLLLIGAFFALLRLHTNVIWLFLAAAGAGFGAALLGMPA